MANAQAFAHKNNSFDNDTLVICTGTQVKIISSIQFYEFGKIVEVSTSLEHSDLNDLSCPIDTGIEPSKLSNSHTQSTLEQRVNFLQLSAYIRQNPYLSISFPQALTRAPPLFMCV